LTSNKPKTANFYFYTQIWFLSNSRTKIFTKYCR